MVNEELPEWGFVLLKITNQMNQTDQIDGINQLRD